MGAVPAFVARSLNSNNRSTGSDYARRRQRFRPVRVRGPAIALAPGDRAGGRFLTVHLATNASILDGGATFQQRVAQIHDIGANTLLAVEWLFIFLPILAHGAIGLVIVTRGKRNFRLYPYRENLHIRGALDGRDHVRFYSLARLPDPRLDHEPVVGRACHAAVGRRDLRCQAGRRHGGRVHSGIAGRPNRLSRRHPRQRLPFLERVVDLRHHLGRLDQPALSAWASLPCLAIGLALAIIGLAALVGMITIAVAMPGANSSGVAALDHNRPSPALLQTGLWPCRRSLARVLFFLPRRTSSPRANKLMRMRDREQRALRWQRRKARHALSPSFGTSLPGRRVPSHYRDLSELAPEAAKRLPDAKPK